MIRGWPLIAILLANLLAAITCFLSGKWVAETNRYDGCEYIAYRGAYLCQIEEPEWPPAKGAEA